ncbi:hypothetical protein ACETWN_00585 [Aeromonas hydrophila]|uniref:hypothetical protein n=1 Tax=Aeromonas hydrophila TaxID=644 RepID=UPI0035A2B77C
MNQRTELRLRYRRDIKNKKTELATINEQKLVQTQTALAFLPLITAAVYLFGMAWHMGYVSVFHVDSSEFPLSTEQTLLTGTFSLITNLAPMLGYPIAAFVGLLVIVVVIVLTFKLTKRFRDRALSCLAQLFKNEKVNKNLISIFKYSAHPDEVKWVTILIERAMNWYIRFCYVLFTSCIIGLLAYYSYQNGINQANEQKSKMQKGTYLSANTLKYSEHPNGILALRIVCNATQCTFWNEKDGTIYLRYDQIDSVTIPLKSDITQLSADKKIR